MHEKKLHLKKAKVHRNCIRRNSAQLFAPSEACTLVVMNTTPTRHSPSIEACLHPVSFGACRFRVYLFGPAASGTVVGMNAATAVLARTPNLAVASRRASPQILLARTRMNGRAPTTSRGWFWPGESHCSTSQGVGHE